MFHRPSDVEFIDRMPEFDTDDSTNNHLSEEVTDFTLFDNGDGFWYDDGQGTTRYMTGESQMGQYLVTVAVTSNGEYTGSTSNNSSMRWKFGYSTMVYTSSGFPSG